MADFYQVLGVPPTAGEAAIRAAYKALIQRYHPDRQPDDRDRAEARVREITEAYATLRDPIRRARYDHRRALARPAYARSGYAPAAYARPAPPPPPYARRAAAPPPPRHAGRWAWLAAVALALPLAGVVAWRAAAPPPPEPPIAADPFEPAVTAPAPGAITASVLSAARAEPAPVAPAPAPAPSAPPGWKIERGAYGCFAALPVDASRSVLLLPYRKAGRGGIGVRDRSGIAMVKNRKWIARTDGDEIAFYHPTAEGSDTVWLGEVLTPGLDGFVGPATTLTIAAETPHVFVYAPLTSVAQALAAARRCR